MKVIVVGAGLAGLSAAYELSKIDDIDLTLIEANDYAGGRVRSIDIDGHPVDFGGFLIYPWYKRFHTLIDELELKGNFSKLPKTGVFYSIDKDVLDLKLGTDLRLKKSDALSVFLKCFKAIWNDSDPSNPKLDAYNHMSVREFVHTLNLSPELNDHIISLFDTVSQGYGYGSVDQLKMAFMAAILRKSTLYGDVLKSFYFKDGTKVFVDKMVEKIKSNGGKINLNTHLNAVDGKTLKTSDGNLEADKIVFAQNVTSGIYKDLLGEVNINWQYSSFLTATIRFDKPAEVYGSKYWGACFYRADDNERFPIVSAVNLGPLYSEDIDCCTNFNIKVRGNVEVSKSELLDSLKIQLKKYFPTTQPLEVIEAVSWENLMPLADEEFVKIIQNNQGKNGYYFAGDFLGCPSMETALMTGYRAAKLVIEKTSD